MSTLKVLLLVHCNYVRKFPLCNRDIMIKISRYNRNRDIKFNRDISLIAIYRGNTGYCPVVKPTVAFGAKQPKVHQVTAFVKQRTAPHFAFVYFCRPFVRSRMCFLFTFGHLC